ncbi:hypothetical protein Pcinc_009335 [Petrolisthes cinctipes]|uniref:Uncharacterized protein n=1 Tax=Petrolisthes cinctipes TaxID=88211 RepID=A0AAE1KVK9_PETCI|nr:hypothetical protein Pcinc_009335 [Petrolisthes cinctipes]
MPWQPFYLLSPRRLRVKRIRKCLARLFPSSSNLSFNHSHCQRCCGLIRRPPNTSPSSCHNQMGGCVRRRLEPRDSLAHSVSVALSLHLLSTIFMRLTEHVDSLPRDTLHLDLLALRSAGLYLTHSNNNAMGNSSGPSVDAGRLTPVKEVVANPHLPLPNTSPSLGCLTGRGHAWNLVGLGFPGGQERTNLAMVKKNENSDVDRQEITSEATKNREVLQEIVAIHPQETEFDILDVAVLTLRLSTIKENTDVDHLEEELKIVKKERDELLKEKEAMNEAMINLKKEMQTLDTRTRAEFPYRRDFLLRVATLADMAINCSVRECKSRQREKENEAIKFHRFPKSEM